MIGDPIQARARHQEEEKKNGANQQLWEPRPGRGHPACGHALFQGYQRQGTTAGTVREQGQAAEPQGEALLFSLALQYMWLLSWRELLDILVKTYC